MTNTHYIGQTLTINNTTVVVRKVISNNLLKVSYGFDTKGNDVLGLVRL